MSVRRPEGTKPLLAKRLRKTDCSYFEPFFRAHSNSRQKAINLDKNKMRDLFPSLSNAENSTKFPVQVDWFFDSEKPITLVQNVGLSEKNWRLNSMPWVDHEVAEGDIVVCQILSDDVPPGERVPTGIALALVRPGDQGHEWLDQRLPEIRVRERGGFVNLDDAALLAAEDWRQTSAVWQLIDFLTRGVVAMVEGVIADEDGDEIPKLALRSIEDTGSTREAVRGAEKLLAAIGLGGETLVDAYLEDMVERGAIVSFRWISKLNKLAPVDFAARNADVELGIEVKTTKGRHAAPFFISIEELRAGRDIEPYEIWRVSGFTWTETELSGSIRKSDPTDLVKRTLDGITALPQGVKVPTVQMFPSALSWTEPEEASCPRARIPSETWESDINIAS
jgi:hypothetical protein